MKWTVCLALGAISSLTACATTIAPPDVRETVDTVAPDIQTYGQQFQRHMAAEVEALAEAECPREGVMPTDCSALLTWVLDQQRLRDQVETLRE